MEQILALAKKETPKAEVFLYSYEETPAIFEANRLKHLHTIQGSSIVLRLIREGRIGCSSTTHLDDRQSLVDRAIGASQFGAIAKFELPTAEAYAPIEVYDPAIESITLEEIVEIGNSLIARVREYEPELICEVQVARGIASIHLQNTQGGEAKYKKSIFYIAIEGTLIKGTDMLFVGESEVSCHPIKDVSRYSTIVESVKKQLEWAKNTATVTSRYLPVIFTPRGVAMALIPPLAVAFNGKTVLQGASPLGTRREEMVFDQRLSLYDNATIDHRPRSRPCDDEGIPSRCTSLIEKGIVKDFLYDLQTAGMANTRSTGNGNRGNGGLPTPGISALLIEPGDTKFQDMVQNMKEGLIIDQLIGAGQTNILGGEFGGNILLGYKVEGGEITGRVKDTVVSGNVYEVLSKLGAVGQETKWVGDSVCAPALYCQELAIASQR